MSEIVCCPACEVRVIAKTDGMCPSCGAVISMNGSPIAPSDQPQAALAQANRHSRRTPPGYTSGMNPIDLLLAALALPTACVVGLVIARPDLPLATESIVGSCGLPYVVFVGLRLRSPAVVASLAFAFGWCLLGPQAVFDPRSHGRGGFFPTLLEVAAFVGLGLLSWSITRLVGGRVSKRRAKKTVVAESENGDTPAPYPVTLKSEARRFAALLAAVSYVVAIWGVIELCYMSYRGFGSLYPLVLSLGDLFYGALYDSSARGNGVFAARQVLIGIALAIAFTVIATVAYARNRREHSPVSAKCHR